MALNIITSIPFTAYLRDSKNYIVDAVYQLESKEKSTNYVQHLSSMYNLPFVLINHGETRCSIILKGINCTEVSKLMMQKLEIHMHGGNRTLQ